MTGAGGATYPDRMRLSEMILQAEANGRWVERQRIVAMLRAKVDWILARPHCEWLADVELDELADAIERGDP
jgi:hypothetical protein